MFSNLYSENRSVYEIMWEKYGGDGQATDDNIIYRIRFISRMRDARMQAHIYSFSTATILTRTRLHVTLINTLPFLLNFI
jgi:hypothetical protein